MKPEEVISKFNGYINARDIDGLESMMTDDHVFIDIAQSVIRGREKVLEAWRDFFAEFPDYQNIFESIRVEGNAVTITGHSTCSKPIMDGPAIWTAEVEGDSAAHAL